ncbi:MAG: hypothetical protein KDH95_05890 [Calditrichaeota bacterium]|nr:hypothetical protein [Calditrichota bacterium]MCB0267676.1 hypothetical protein [Calditrichota bacterium]
MENPLGWSGFLDLLSGYFLLKRFFHVGLIFAIFGQCLQTIQLIFFAPPANAVRNLVLCFAAKPF